MIVSEFIMELTKSPMINKNNSMCPVICSKYTVHCDVFCCLPFVTNLFNVRIFVTQVKTLCSLDINSPSIRDGPLCVVWLYLTLLSNNQVGIVFTFSSVCTMHWLCRLDHHTDLFLILIISAAKCPLAGKYWGGCVHLSMRPWWWWLTAPEGDGVWGGALPFPGQLGLENVVSCLSGGWSLFFCGAVNAILGHKNVWNRQLWETFMCELLSWLVAGWASGPKYWEGVLPP